MCRSTALDLEGVQIMAYIFSLIRNSQIHSKLLDSSNWCISRTTEIDSTAQLMFGSLLHKGTGRQVLSTRWKTSLTVPGWLYYMFSPFSKKVILKDNLFFFFQVVQVSLQKIANILINMSPNYHESLIVCDGTSRETCTRISWK